MRIKYHPNGEAGYSDVKRADVQFTVDDFLKDFPDVAAIVTHDKNDCCLIVDESKVEDIASFLNNMREKICHEIQFSFKEFSQLITRNGKQTFLKHSKYNSAKFAYFNVLPVLKDSTDAPIDCLFRDYGTFYKDKIKDDSLNFSYYRHIQLSDVLSVFIETNSTKHTEEKKINVHTQFYSNKCEVKKSNEIYLLDVEEFQNYKTDLNYSVVDRLKSIRDFIESKLKLYADLDNVKNFSVTSNGTIHLDDDRVIIINMLNGYYSYSYRFEKNLEIYVYDVKDDLIIEGHKLTKCQKRKTPVDINHIYSRIDEYLDLVKGVLTEDKIILEELAKTNR